MVTGQIIYMNGTSSAGKSTIATALQEVLDEPYLHVGIDLFLLMLPERYRPGNSEGVEWISLPDGGVRPAPGAVHRRLRSGMYHAVDALVCAGISVVLDDVINGPETLSEAVWIFRDHRVLFVGLHCPLPILEERERARENRRPGTARGMLELAHAHGLYDLEIDTSLASARDCAAEIRGRLQDGPEPVAFRQLRRQLAGDGS